MELTDAIKHLKQIGMLPPSDKKHIYYAVRACYPGKWLG